MADQRTQQLSSLATPAGTDLVPVGKSNYATGTITGATKANPCVVTSNSHGLSNGDIVYIHNVSGMVELNNLSYTVANVATNTFELTGINSTGYTTYTSGGTWIRGRLQQATVASLRTGMNARTIPGLCQHRLGLETGVDFSTTDQTGKTTVYLTPTLGNLLSLYDGTNWEYSIVPEIAITIGTKTSGKNYDIFAFTSTATPSSTNTGTDVVTFGSATGWETGSVVRAASTIGGLTAGTDYWYRAASSTTGTFHTTLAGALANTGLVDLTANITQSLTTISLEFSAAWTSDTARSDAIARQDGAWVKSGTTTRLYLGTIRTTATTTTADADATRFVWNHHNRRPKRCYKTDATSHTVNGTATREWNEGTALRAEFIIGLADQSVTWTVLARVYSTNLTPSVFIYAALDTTAYTWGSFGQGSVNNYDGQIPTANAIPSIGYHYLTIRENEGLSLAATVDQGFVVGRIDG